MSMNKLRVLIVDDEVGVLNSLTRTLRNYQKPLEVISESDPRNALNQIKTETIDILITDQRMPLMGGLLLIHEAKKLKPDLQMILMSGYTDFDVVVDAINDGHITGFIMKPWLQREVDLIMTRAIASKQERDFIKFVTKQHMLSLEDWKVVVQRLEEDEQGHDERTVRALSLLIQAKDAELYQHSVRIGELAMHLGNQFSLSKTDLRRLEIGALLHDLGKVAIRDHIHYKSGKLNEEEFTQMKKHPLYGAEILEALGMDPKIVEIVKHHHEHVCGDGYPDGLKGDDISLLTKIITISDAYDAMTSDRIYRKGMTPEETLRIIKESVGVIYDAKVFSVLEASIVL